jgi:hypothetical protein
MLRFLVYLSQFRKALTPRIDRWIQDGVFQLQRRAYEAEGEGTWTDLDKEIPNVADGHQFSDLTIQTLPKTLPCPSCSHTSSKDFTQEKSNGSKGSPMIVQTEDLFGTLSTLPEEHEKSRSALEKSDADDQDAIQQDPEYWDSAHLSRASTAVHLTKSLSAASTTHPPA